MKIKAVIFDLDGVLVDATEWHYEALNRALGLFGYNIARYEHLTTYNGLPTRKKLEMLSVEKNFPRGLHSAGESHQAEIHARRDFAELHAGVRRRSFPRCTSSSARVFAGGLLEQHPRERGVDVARERGASNT